MLYNVCALSGFKNSWHLLMLIALLLTNFLSGSETGTVFRYSYASDPKFECLYDWKENVLIPQTPKKSAKTAVLIIHPPVWGGYDFVHNRWRVGRKVWEQYMNSHPNVDCYFVSSRDPRVDLPKDQQVWIEGNDLFVGDEHYKKYKADRLTYKTIRAMEYLAPQYTHFVRTNLNVFMNLDALDRYNSTHHIDFFTAFLWQNAWYPIGYGVAYTTKVATHMVKEYDRLASIHCDHVSHNRSDDGVLASLATGIDPYTKPHLFRRAFVLPYAKRQLMSYPSLATNSICPHATLIPDNMSLNNGLNLCERSTSETILWRKRAGFNLDELAVYYDYLLKKVYPNLKTERIQGYVNELNELSSKQ
jgi:hypothetical protein